MSSKITGDLSETATTRRLVWKIPKFSSLRRTVGKCFNDDSPSFIFMNTSFHLRVFPPDESYDWLSVYLIFENGSTRDITISISIQKSDGTLIGTKTAYGFLASLELCTFFKGSDLRNRNLELLPSDTLTLICDLKCDLNTLSLAEEANNFKKKTTPELCEHTRQTGQQSLCQDYKKVFLDGQNHDFILKVGDKEFPVHRDILRARSRVFESMFSHDMKEKNSGAIDVPDCDPNAMKEFLLYIYCGEVETLDESNMIGLYYIADKYDVETLKVECCEFIKKSMSLANVCEVIQLALNHNDSSLLECVTRYFCSNSHNILPTVGWQSFLKSNSTVANELLIKAINALRNTNN